MLFMLHDHFSTNIKHGATYALQDLFSVQLRGENLKSFISNWDQVLAGIVQTPDESVLETLFYKQVKNCKAIQHDMNEYHRADEATEKRNYSFLVSAVRRHLDRERLEANGDRVAKGLSGSGRPSAPAVEGKTGFIPKGYCVAWNKGGCSKDNCTYKHETPKPRDRSRKPSKTRGRSTERSGSPKPKGKGKKICKFWKQGRCDRGAGCKFLHEGSVGKPRQATPARSASSDNKNKKRNPKNPKRKGSRGSSRSKSPKSPKSPKSKGSGTSSSKPSPAAVCLVASMLASVSQAFCIPQPRVVCPSIRFDDSPDVSLVKARGNLRPIGNAVTRGKVTFPWGHQFEVDQLAVNDAALTGTMLAGSVSNCLRGVECKCAYLCDTDFGCNECIPKGIKATPAECREDVKGAINLELDWIADTGSAQDLVNDSELPDDYGYYSNNPIRMITANGESSSSKQGKVFVPKLGKTIDPYLVRSSPPVISVGMRCIDDGYDFIWRGSKGEPPYMVKPNGERIELVVRDYVPYFANNSKTISTPSTQPRPSIATPASDEAQQSPEPDGDIEIIGDDPMGINVDLPEPQPVQVEEVDVPDADREVEPPVESSKGSSSSVHDDGAHKRSLGEKELKEEAKSIRHMLTHIPKNPFCDICTRAKMFKPPSRAVGGSTKVKAEKFGDHITADFIVTRDEDELGIDDEKSALVVKDIATGFMYVYPNARRTTNAAILAIKHFVGHEDKIGVFYSDNAPELISAMKILQCRHVLSRDHISKSNAQAERAVRSVLEGTRVNLLQAGLNHWHWPHAARHWCFMQNVIATGGDKSPWELRFGSRFDGPLIPFGCLIDYWNGPRKKNKEGLRFDPTSSPGLFLGYAIHPEFMWRKEFMVVPTKDLIENESNGTASILRVLKIHKPDETQFPLQGRTTFGKDDPGLSEALGNQEPTLEDQDAEMGDDDESQDESFQLSTAHAVHDETWLPFMRHIKDREGWYEYAIVTSM